MVYWLVAGSVPELAGRGGPGKSARRGAGGGGGISDGAESGGVPASCGADSRAGEWWELIHVEQGEFMWPREQAISLSAPTQA